VIISWFRCFALHCGERDGVFVFEGKGRSDQGVGCASMVVGTRRVSMTSLASRKVVPSSVSIYAYA
jgi:hypothetical protein